MLHTKFQGHRSIASGEEDFLRFLPYMGMTAINFHSHSHLSFHMSTVSKSPNCFCEKQVLTLKSELTQGHNLNNLGSTCIDNATY